MRSITDYLAAKKAPQEREALRQIVKDASSALADVKPSSEVLVVSPPINVWDPILTEAQETSPGILLAEVPSPLPVLSQPIPEESAFTSSVMEQMKAALEAHRIFKTHRAKIRVKAKGKRASIRREIRMKMQKASRRMNSRHK